MSQIKAMFQQITTWEDLLTKNIGSKSQCGMILLYGGPLKEHLHEKLLGDKDKLRSYLYRISMESVTAIRNQITKIQKNL